MDPFFGNLNDDELLSLARSAGVLPEEASEPAHIDMEETQEPAHIDMEESQPERQDFRTWVPGVNPTIPEAPKNISAGMSTSQRGFSGDRYEQVKGKEGDLEYDLAQADARARASEARSTEVVGAAGRSMFDAARTTAQANVDYVHKKGEQSLVLQRLQDEFAAEESQAIAEAQSMANQAKADYLAALADFRAARVDPSAFWKALSPGERFGTLVTAFVHDFLGAKGINSSAMATLNKAIDRNIDAQIQGIKTKGEVAEGFKSLWWMQRNQAASDAEARERVRGFLLESTKQQIIAAMTNSEAALASAQGKAAIAEIDKELAKSYIEIFRHTDANAVALRNQALDKWKTKVQASLEQSALALRRQELDLARGAKGGGMDSIEPIFDPESGKAMWYFQPWVTEKERVATREMMTALDSLNKEFIALRDLARQAESINDVAARTRLAGTIQQKYNALATKMAHGFAKANEERATDKDVQDFLLGMRQKTWLNQADVEQVLAFTQENLISPAYAKIKQVAFDMPEEVSKRFGSTAKTTPFAGSLIDAKRSSNPLIEEANVTQRKEANEMIGSPGARRPLEEDEITSQVRDAHKEAKRQYPHLFNETRKATGPGGFQWETGVEVGPTQEEFAMVRLRNLARDGDTAALKQLQTYAAPYLNPSGSGTPVSEDPNSVFAALMLSTLSDE